MGSGPIHLALPLHRPLYFQSGLVFPALSRISWRTWSELRLPDPHSVNSDPLTPLSHAWRTGNTYFRGEEYGDAAEVYGEALEALQSATGSAKADEARILGNRAGTASFLCRHWAK